MKKVLAVLALACSWILRQDLFAREYQCIQRTVFGSDGFWDLRRYFLFVSITVFSLAVNGQNLDTRLLKKFNADDIVGLDPTLRFFTNSVTPLTIAAPAAFITYAIIKKDSTSKHNAIFACSAFIMNGVVTTALKDLVKRPRPYLAYSSIEKETSGGHYSFPSGHTSTAFSIATTISIAYPKWYVIVPSYLWASVVGYSRMDLGVHYPSDVLAGALVGSGTAFLSYKLNQWITHKRYLKRRS